jgi:DNA-binding NtrC family response regulator
LIFRAVVRFGPAGAKRVLTLDRGDGEGLECHVADVVRAFSSETYARYDVASPPTQPDMTLDDEIVFVVDDDASVRRGLERLLRAAGHRVESFTSGREFLLRCRSDLRGCLLLDVRMPEITGLELRDTIAALGVSIPIVFITGHGDIRMAVQAMKHGAVDFLTKPFDDVTLLDAVSLALARGRARRAKGLGSGTSTGSLGER